MTGTLLSVNVASVVRDEEWADGGSGIDKRPIEGPVRLFDHHVDGDVVKHRDSHGGVDKAVYAYAREDALWWEEQIGEPIAPGRFGENLTTLDLAVSTAVLGERWAIGSAILEVSQPRIPCRIFAGFWNRPTLVKEFTEAARPGAYLRIVQEGSVASSDRIEIISRPDHGVRVQTAFKARTGAREMVPELLRVDSLPLSWHDWARKVLDGQTA